MKKLPHRRAVSAATLLFLCCFCEWQTLGCHSRNFVN